MNQARWYGKRRLEEIWCIFMFIDWYIHFPPLSAATISPLNLWATIVTSPPPCFSRCSQCDFLWFSATSCHSHAQPHALVGLWINRKHRASPSLVSPPVSSPLTQNALTAVLLPGPWSVSSLSTCARAVLLCGHLPIPLLSCSSFRPQLNITFVASTSLKPSFPHHNANFLT